MKILVCHSPEGFFQVIGIRMLLERERERGYFVQESILGRALLHKWHSSFGSRPPNNSCFSASYSLTALIYYYCMLQPAHFVDMYTHTHIHTHTHTHTRVLRGCCAGVGNISTNYREAAATASKSSSTNE